MFTHNKVKLLLCALNPSESSYYYVYRGRVKNIPRLAPLALPPPHPPPLAENAFLCNIVTTAPQARKITPTRLINNSVPSTPNCNRPNGPATTTTAADATTTPVPSNR